MRYCLFDIRKEFAFLYLDYVIAFFEDLKSHLHHLKVVLLRLTKRCIKISPAKCKSLKKEVSFFDRVTTEDGYKIDSKK